MLAADGMEELGWVALPPQPYAYEVQSTSMMGLVYTVDLDAYICSCASFPRIEYCKHIAAVQKLTQLSEAGSGLLLNSAMQNTQLSGTNKDEPGVLCSMGRPIDPNPLQSSLSTQSLIFIQLTNTRTPLASRPSHGILETDPSHYSPAPPVLATKHLNGERNRASVQQDA
jgi:hypothetical protein